MDGTALLTTTLNVWKEAVACCLAVEARCVCRGQEMYGNMYNGLVETTMRKLNRNFHGVLKHWFFSAHII